MSSEDSTDTSGDGDSGNVGCIVLVVSVFCGIGVMVFDAV